MEWVGTMSRSIHLTYCFPILTKEQVYQAIKLKEKHTSKQVASRFGVGRSTLLRYISKERRGA